KCSIAVSGTHGKSTTSAMIAHILTECGKNPTALLGAEYPPFGSNVRLGDPDLVVVEADESDGSFTLLKPTIAVVTNVEPEHLENYDDSEDELWRAFEMFVSQAQTAVLNAGEPSTVARLRPHAERCMFYSDKTVENLMLAVPGRHNALNGAAALTAVSLVYDVRGMEIVSSLCEFRGITRRFEFKGEANGILLYDDYAHHPTEVKSTLAAARDFLQRPLLVIYQPHRYSRTQQMGHEFGPCFEAADRVIVTQLYAAFEQPIEGVSGRIVHDAVRQQFPDKPLCYAQSLDEARHLASELARRGDAILTMGAGDVGTLAPLILQDLQLKETHGRAA
ncbi:MAG TPA: Mur ligase family protein, partial [Abditibacteriaceae bacterium]|nr:Mur ligase family protein [Abditibacteriaceae bacterium]